VVAKQQRLHIQVGNLRLLYSWSPCGSAGWRFRSTALGQLARGSGAAFVALFVYHERVIRDRDRAKRAEATTRALSRESRIVGPVRARSGERFRDSAHPYAEDLDLFGKGSLFELLSTARTRGGENKLARWLLGPADAETVRERQSAVAELRPMLDLREGPGPVGRKCGDARASRSSDRLGGGAGRFDVGWRANRHYSAFLCGR
jgi:hypothetical protein